MSRVALILLLALSVLAVAWGFSHMAAPESDPASAPPAPAARRGAPATSATAPSPAPPATRGSSAAPATGGLGASSGGPRSAPDDEPTGGGAARDRGPLRDLFAYADESAPARAPATGGGPAPAPAVSASPTPRPVRLVGFVRQAGRLRAALWMHGDVVLAASGERAGDYAVVTLDEDAGVRLRGPDGAEFTLRPER